VTFRKIKKQNGERFAKAIRGYHNGIFEIPNIVPMVKYAGKDAVDAEAIMNHLVSLLSREVVESADKDWETLLDEAGYDSYYADTLDKQNAISKYFKSGEALCTFGDHNRFKNYYIINAIKKDVDTILREDFKGKEKREDEYGTSVLSIQVAKKGGFISIKNRYNHTVPSCDNTFGSNPDNIIPGLSSAIQKGFKVSFSNNSLLPDSHIICGDKIVKTNFELDGIYYGDTCYVQNGEIVEVLPVNGEYLFDTFIFDAKTKTFRSTNSLSDSFPDDLNKAYGGCKTLYVKNYCLYDGDVILIDTRVDS